MGNLLSIVQQTKEKLSDFLGRTIWNGGNYKVDGKVFVFIKKPIPGEKPVSIMSLEEARVYADSLFDDVSTSTIPYLKTPMSPRCSHKDVFRIEVQGFSGERESEKHQCAWCGEVIHSFNF